MEENRLPRGEEELAAYVVGLYTSFYEDSRFIREKYERDHALYLEQTLGRDEGSATRTGTPVLYSTYRAELSDAMEAMPEAVFLARRKEDEPRAAKLTGLCRGMLERLGFAEQYLRLCEFRARYGMGFAQITMEKGETQIRAYDPRAIYVDPLCEDMQQGRALFKVSCHTPAYYRLRYPRAFARIMEREHTVAGWAGTQTIPLVCMYMKEALPGGGIGVHMVKVAAGVVVYDSRGDFPLGLYPHGEYPFVAWLYDRIPGTPWGFGVFDYLAPVQRYIDRLDTLLLRSIARAASPRLFVSRSSGVDPEQLRDEREEIIQADRIDESAMRWQPPAPQTPYAMEMLNLKCEMLKRESGQNAATRGESPGLGISSGTAISMLQAAGSKRANLAQQAINTAFEKTIHQMVSNLYTYGAGSENYRSGETYLQFDREDAQGGWAFDLQIRLQRMPQYQSVYQNQLLLQLVQMSQLTPRAALEMMDVENKASILAKMDEVHDTDAKTAKEEPDHGRTAQKAAHADDPAANGAAR